ncbi:hypothetical protein [Sorlinia euscelidii]|uniref:hypothetical protein n=1 Tax=Sorlinia euscelidii TaxID=3081148 RepID=UPI00374E0A13
MIRRRGRIMSLRHAAPESAMVKIMAYAAPVSTAFLTDGMPRQAFIAEITHDELARAPSYGRPSAGDVILDGDRRYTLTDACPVYDGQQIVGWKLIAAGGT